MGSIIVFLITLINPPVGFVISLVGLFGDRKNWKTYILCISIFFASAAYCYVPENANPDLYRYFEYIISLRGHGFIETITNSYEGSNLYSFNLLVWISNVFQDEHLVPAISVFLIYIIALYCTCYVGIKEQIEWKHVFLFTIIQMATLDWYSLTNNVRNVLAFAVIGYAIFRDVYMRKKDIVAGVCYIFPIFIHPTAMIFLLVRVILLFSKRKFLKPVLIIGTLLINPVVNYLHSVIYSITSNPYVVLVVNKAYNYLFDTSTEYGLAISSSLRSLVTRVFYLSLMAVIIIVFFENARLRMKVNGNEITKEREGFSVYVIVTCLLALACMFMLRPEYWRFSATAIIFSGIIVVPFFSNANKSRLTVLSKAIFLLLTVGCFVLWAYQLTWMNGIEMLIELLTTSPIGVAVRMFVNALGVS